ncbi:hypothetical protein E1211_17895 [Micromonospora sp. 15K316]|uniref:hypothetical protein n=1 Tax=Micromonospora sp. 15K316 TaxID=2530376 RepID=UPI001045E11D|nr:hypothetical protein [Micromonospora sp. 15K316]TDC34220.1 hypothetical protein E1211_17895 [Micromonospora sp. 15K316]
MDRVTVTARRAARAAARSARRAVTIDLPTDDGQVKTRRIKQRRPSRQTTRHTAIVASQLGVA